MTENKFNLSGITTSVLVRGIMTVIAAVNIICGYLGLHLVPLSDTEVGEIVNGLIVIATAAVWAWGWWKNNSLTVNAQTADKVLAELNTGVTPSE